MTSTSASFLPPSTRWRHSGKTALPVDLAVALKPWFAADTLGAAGKLIDSRLVSQYLFFRHGTAVIFTNGSSALLLMPNNPKIRQGFTCRDGWCSCCKGPTRGELRCQHLAVVALLSLGRGQEVDELPVPLLFQKSPWYTVGHHLFGIGETKKIAVTLKPIDRGYLLRATDDAELQLELLLTRGAAVEIHRLFGEVYNLLPDGNNTNITTEQKLSHTLQTVFHSLVSRCRTQNEIDLKNMGTRSKGERQDTSFWMFLARLLCIDCPFPELIVQRQKNGLFVLQTKVHQGDPIFHLTIPRTHCVDLLDTLTLPGLSVKRRQAATPFSVVSFTPDHNNISVEHHARLKNASTNETTISLTKLKNYRYGTHYYLENYGFFGIPSLKETEKLRLTLTGPQLSLFAAVDKIKQPETGFTITTENIPSFLKLNANALHSGRHQVATEILELDIVREPEKLQLVSYEEIDDWCYLAGFYDLGNQSIQLDEILRATGNKKKYIAGKKWLQLTDTSLAWFHELGEDRICTDEYGEDARIRLRRHEMLALAGLVQEIAPPINEKDMQAQLQSLLLTDDWLKPLHTDQLPGHLRDYQRHGVAWLEHLAGFHLGGILADDMGLGKTHQALTLLSQLASRYKDAHYLIVCPTSVLLHWLDKGKHFFSELTMALYYGHNRDLATSLKAEVIVTTIGIMRNDIDKLAKIHFQVILFDEMQNLKNAKTDSHRAALRLDGDSLIGLTGTPIENSLIELKSLFDICLPGMFSKKSFRRFTHDDSPQTRAQLRALIQPFILRRTRSKVLKELPPVIDDMRLCELHVDQLGLYKQVVEESGSLIQELLDDHAQVRYVNILATITRLKQVCNHPCLLAGNQNYTKYGSGKWDLWQDLIDECMTGGLKVVVFSHFTSMLEVMASYLKAKDLTFCMIKGNMTPKQRQQAIDDFSNRDSCRICLASLLAGGVGIDLTAAQVVIHYDRWWNPAKEEQATARVHRMGQKHTVQVIKLVSTGTLEEKIHGLIEKKRALADDIITEDDASIMKQLSRNDLASLLQWQG